MTQPIDNPAGAVVDEASVIAALDGATVPTATVAGTDKVLIQDTDDSDNLKTVTAQSIADLGIAGTVDLEGLASSTSITIDTANDLMLMQDVTDSTQYAITFDDLATELGSGGIGGSTGATDNSVLRADGTGGSTAQNSPGTLDDTGILRIAQNSAQVGPTVRLVNSTGTTNEKVWEMLAYVTGGSLGEFYLRSLDDAETTQSLVMQVTRSGTTITNVYWWSGDHHYTAGIEVGSPTGGIQGNGTINAEAVYDDGSLLTDYVFDAELDGSIDTTFYDNSVPNRSRRNLVAGPRKGQSAQVQNTPEVRVHQPARDFSTNITELDITSFSNKWKADRKLPAFSRLSARSSKASLGEINQALLETCELQAVHIDKLQEQINLLEGRVTALEGN